MTSTQAEEDDHGLSVYQQAFARAQRPLASFKPDVELAVPSLIVNEDSDRLHQDPSAGFDQDPSPTGSHGNDDFLNIPKASQVRPHPSHSQTWQPSENHGTHPRGKVQVTDNNGELTTPRWPGQDMAAPRSMKDIEENSTSQNGLLNVKHKVIAADDWSEAEVSFQDNKTRRGLPSWYSKRGGNNDDDGSSSDGNDRPVHDPNDEAYDSDLVTEASGDVRVVREHAKKARKWRALASGRFETMLLESIVNTDQIPAKYENIFVDREIIRELERVTRLSRDRKKAFSCGVLKGNRVTGAILWGPPGTGKTLLAKGLAKESGCNMISITTAELWQKCHGEDEKVIKALFSLGRKIHPCIIFLDEADAMLGARKAGEKRHIRSMLNQFLMEWDGLMSGLNSPFVLLATNRPFDLDPAVLRRAPVYIYLDVPSQWDRQNILELLLKDEKLEQGLNASIIASLTHKYTGSDLKNLCVTAATHCVDEQAEAGEEDTTERTLTWAHFWRAMKTVKPTSLSSTMRNEFQKFQKKSPLPGTNGHGHYQEDED
ncbi:P-loop containing nucleoside triphosphate hydrolase protein [Biscogniauxia marginata]|nr:P-loop containing nucleoside triphosphate hydrolase protein [Biscogniauxia marginata]